MYPRQFDYAAPSTLAEALSALSGDNAKVMAGGMSLIPLLKLRLLSPALVVDIGHLPDLDQFVDNGEYIAIGALVRHHQTAGAEWLPAALRTAASWTGDVQVRNRGTTCGSVAHADLASDQPGAILALGGTMVAQGTGGTREIAADDFFVDAMTTALAPGEILTEIRVPKREGSSAYDKLGRRGGHTDYAVAGAAAWVAKSNGSVSDCRVALTGVSTKPTLAAGVAEALIGTDGSEKAIEAAASKAAEGMPILEDLYGSVAYKTHLAQVFTRRALTAALAG
jgi:carbon-monoxide dehydrogenase medium subunit